jgi:hypothetical protein
VKLGDHRERCSTPWCRERARVAVGQDAPGVGEQIRTVGSDCIRGGLLLSLDRTCLRERIRRGADTVHRPREVDRGGTRRLEDLGGALAVGIKRNAVAGRDSDQRRASNGQPPNRVGDLGGARQNELVRLKWQSGLIERP